MNEPETATMVERLRAFTAALVQCKSALETLDSVPRGRIVSSLLGMYRADVDAYRERSTAVVRMLLESDDEQRALAQDDADTLAALRAMDTRQGEG
jgi:hypothetical protein